MVSHRPVLTGKKLRALVEENYIVNPELRKIYKRFRIYGFGKYTSIIVFVLDLFLFEFLKTTSYEVFGIISMLIIPVSLTSSIYYFLCRHVYRKKIMNILKK